MSTTDTKQAAPATLYEPVEGALYVFGPTDGQLCVFWGLDNRCDCQWATVSWHATFPMSRESDMGAMWRVPVQDEDRLRDWANRWFRPDQQIWPLPAPARYKGARLGIHAVQESSRRACTHE